MEDLIKTKSQILKSIGLGFKLFGILLLDILVVFTVTYLFDVENFFTNGGRTKLNSSATMFSFITIILIWIIFIAWHYRKAKANHIFNINFKFSKKYLYFIPFTFIIPILVFYLFNNKLELSLLYKYNYFLTKSNGDVLDSLFNTSLQFIYWIIESFILIFIIDCFNNISKLSKTLKFIPWGGVGLALTWCISLLLTNPNSFFKMVFISIFAGVIYRLSNRNFVLIFIYFLVTILLRR